MNGVWDSDRLNDAQVKRLDLFYQKRVETLQSVDDLVEGVVERLRSHGKLENTYIIYSSDNGYHLGHHRLQPGKKQAFEEDINVPLIIRGPGIPKNQISDTVSSHVDLTPTILHMAGVDPPRKLDGKRIQFTRNQETNDEYTNVEFWTGSKFLSITPSN